jgi:urease accessory protein
MSMNLMRRLTIISQVQFLFLLWPARAFAHPMKGVGDFYAGMLHPMTAIECILPMVALSLLAGQQRRRTAIGILISFPLACVVGALLGLNISVPHSVAILNIAAMAVLGILVAINRTLPFHISIAVSSILGLTIGWANGGELTPETSAYRFIPGLALAGLLVVTYGIGIVRRLNAPWAQIGIRVAGSWIAAVGILVLGLK